MILLDTSVISFLIRNQPEAELYHQDLEPKSLKFLSAQTIGKIYFGMQRKSWGPTRIANIQKHLEPYTVLPLSGEMALIYGDFMAKAESIGKPLQPQDAWSLATASHHQLRLLTHDRDMLVGNQLGIEIICHA